jgi:hypothetical protein
MKGDGNLAKLDQALVRDANVAGDRLEVRDGTIVELNRDLLLDLRRVLVIPRRGEVVLFVHRAARRTRLAG